MKYIIGWFIFVAHISLFAMDEDGMRKKFDLPSLDVYGPIDYPRIDVRDDCSICIDTIDRMKEPEFKASCNHSFHADCIEEWRKKKKAEDEDKPCPCPLCRQVVENNQLKVAIKRTVPSNNQPPMNLILSHVARILCLPSYTR